MPNRATLKHYQVRSTINHARSMIQFLLK